MLPGIYCPLQKEASAIDPPPCSCPALQDHQSVLLLLSLSHFHPFTSSSIIVPSHYSSHVNGVLPSSSCCCGQFCPTLTAPMRSELGKNGIIFGDQLNALAMPCTTAASQLLLKPVFQIYENWSRSFSIQPLRGFYGF